MREGDYFRWKYKPEIEEQRKDQVMAGTLYWCCATIAIFKSGRLRDIYWSTGSEGRSWTPENAENELELTFLANKDDMVPTTCPEHYEPEDVINISHANMMRSGLYILKGSKKSRRVMKALIEAKIAEAEHEIKWRESSIERLKEKAVEIETADLEKFWV